MKKIVTLLFALLLLCACGNGGSGSGDAPEEDKVITVGVNPVPHAEILENAVKPVLEEAGWRSSM